MSGIVRDFKVLQNFREDQGGYDLYWDYQIPPSMPNFVPWFELQYSEVDTGPWEDALGFRTQNPAAIGVTSKVLTPQIVRYFRIRVYKTQTGGAPVETTAALSRTNNINRHDWLIYREMLRRERLALVKYTGQPVYVFRARIFRDNKVGEEFDELLTDTIASTEKSDGYYSYGNASSGFHPPVLSYATFPREAESAANIAVTDSGENPTKPAVCRFLAFPVLKSGDLIHVPSKRTKWTVKSVDYSMFGAASNEIVAQLASVVLLPQSDPLHRLEVPLAQELEIT